MAEDVKTSIREGWRLLGKVQDLSLPGGRCQFYLLERVTGSSCKSAGEQYAVCNQATLNAECLTEPKVPVSLWTLTEAYPEAGKPSPRAREQVKVFERLIKSIEFKK